MPHVSTQAIQVLCNPLLIPPWPRSSAREFRVQVQQALEIGHTLASSIDFRAAPFNHAARVAHFIEHPSSDPIVLGVEPGSRPVFAGTIEPFDILDGHHRLAAAIARGDRTIAAKVVGPHARALELGLVEQPVSLHPQGRMALPLRAFNAIRSHHLPSLRSALESGLDIDQCLINGDTPIVCSVSSDSSEDCYLYLLTHRPNLRAPCLTGSSVLTEFASSLLGIDGRMDLCRMALAAGADPNHINGQGESPLYRALLFGRVQMAQGLYEAGADLSQPLARHPTALTDATFGVPACQWLIRALATESKRSLERGTSRSTRSTPPAQRL